MENPKQMKSITEITANIQANAGNQKMSKVYRFDIFKGEADQNGKIEKVKSVGAAYLRDGIRTYTLVLKALLKDQFYLLPNTKTEQKADFVILTREPALNIGRKYFWNNVGEGMILDGENHGIMKLSWDIFGKDLYMSLHPINVSDSKEVQKADNAA